MADPIGSAFFLRFIDEKRVLWYYNEKELIP